MPVQEANAVTRAAEQSGADEIARWGAAEITAAVRRREVSRAEMVRAHLDRTAAYDDTLNALTISLGERALADARAADRDPSARDAMPLDGAPVTVKDLFDVEGAPTSEGSATFAGRTASGMAAVGIGIDLAGSIRVPAAFCGPYGLHTTPGLIPTDREFPPRDAVPAFDTMTSAGPLARHPDDLRTVLLALAGPEAAHPMTLSAQPPAPAADRPSRVAMVIDECGAAVDDETVSAVRRTADALRLAGYEVEDAVFPGVERLPDLWGELLMAEVRESAWPGLAPHMNESCRTHAEEMAAYFRRPGDLRGYLRLWQERSALRARVYDWMARYPLVISPLAGWAGAPPLQYDHLVGETETARIVTAMRNALWPPALGLPAVALPNGIQIAARPFHDLDAVAAAQAVGQPVAIADPAGAPTGP